MTSPNILKTREIWEQVHSPSGLAFPETVKALASLGVTRYRIDYTAAKVTTYLDHTGETDITDFPLMASLSHITLGSQKWDADALVTAIRGAQAGTIGGFPAFCAAAVAAGVTDYTCYIDGQRVVYSGANGDAHTEWFPGAKKD